jgi:hypothetical protein
MINNMKQWLKQMFCKHNWIWVGNAFTNNMQCISCGKYRIQAKNRHGDWAWRITLREEIWR